MTGKTTPNLVYHLWIVDEETDCKTYAGQFDSGQAALDAVPEDSVYELLEAPMGADFNEWNQFMTEQKEGF